MHNIPELTKVSLNSRVRFREVAGEGVLVSLESGRVIVVSEVGLRIVESLSNPATLDSLATLISDEFEVSKSQAEMDVESFLLDLDKEDILVHQNQ